MRRTQIGSLEQRGIKQWLARPQPSVEAIRIVRAHAPKRNKGAQICFFRSYELAAGLQKLLGK